MISGRDQVTFIKTPEARPQAPASTECGVRTTDYPCIKNAPLPAEGPGSRHFYNSVLAVFLISVPYYVTRLFHGGFKTFIFFFLLFFFPLLIAWWTVLSTYSPRLDDKVKLPGKPIEYYLKFFKEEDAAKYSGHVKIPMTTFHDKYFAGEVTYNEDNFSDLLDLLEYRHDWAQFSFTADLFKFFLLKFIPEVILHTRSQDEEQVRDHYDRGDDFYSYFLGPRMIYTSGIISNINEEESLEQLQDNKLRVVCEKIGLKEGEHLLDLGCGWGTLAAFASSVYKANCTGVTLGKNQTKWGNEQLKSYDISEEQSKIHCCDYRDTPASKKDSGKYDKITCLEMAEHVGVKNFASFLAQLYDLLEDDGYIMFQYAGLRKLWQYEDLIWGLFMNKYVFPGADASTPLGFVINSLESVGFEIVSTDTIGVHYSATLWRWYRNWLGNRDKVLNTYGSKWFRIWEFFLAYSTIISRQGSATCFQIVLRKNINRHHRVEYIPRQSGLLRPIEQLGTKWFKED